MINNTAFSVLETKILDTNNEELLSIYEGLDNLNSHNVYNFGEILKYTLATSAVLEQQGMLNSYFHIGGGATLLHIANTIGVENIGSWRGTHDMDIVLTQYGLRGTLKSFFSKYEESGSPSIENKKRILLLDSQASDSVDLDLYLPRQDKKTININGYEIPERMLNELKTISVLGIKTRVPKLHDLLGMKLKIDTKSTHLPRKKDMSDIFNIIGCIEKTQGIKEKYITNKKLSEYIYKKLYLEDTTLPERLIKVIDFSKKEKLDYIISSPSTNLINEYRERVEEEKNEN